MLSVISKSVSTIKITGLGVVSAEVKGHTQLLNDSPHCCKLQFGVVEREQTGKL